MPVAGFDLTPATSAAHELPLRVCVDVEGPGRVQVGDEIRVLA
jgi:hypothetical protein